jgi:hypothetical protein
MNYAIRLAHAHGMGGLGNGIDDAFNRLGSGSGSDDGNDFNWNNFANTVGGTLSSIFGHPTANPATQGLTAAQVQAMIAAQNAARSASSNNADDDSGSGLGISFESNYLKLGGAKVPYSMLLLGGLAVMMIQSKGFEKRR